MERSRAIQLRRLAYAILGFVLGFGIIALIRLLFDEKEFTAVEMFMGGLAGASCALWIGEKFRALPTAADLGMLSIREEMAPIDLKPQHTIPKALKTETERRIKL